MYVTQVIIMTVCTLILVQLYYVYIVLLVSGQNAVPVVTTNTGNRQADMLYGLTGCDAQFQAHNCLSRVCYLYHYMLWHYYPVRVCAVGLCVWTRQFVYVCMYICIAMCVYLWTKTGCLLSFRWKISC